MNNDKIIKAFYILAVVMIMTIAAGNTISADNSDRFPDYYAARLALEQGNCEMAVTHLQAYLKKNSYIRQKYPDHYFEIKLVISQCMGKGTNTFKMNGIGDDSDEIAPLPDNPPMTQ
jgi:hypothetical protein